MDLNCPQPVQEYIDKLTPHLIELLKDEECEFDDEILEIVWKKVLIPPLIEKFINGEEIILSEAKMIDIFNELITTCCIESLKKKGIIDYIEDENGEEVIFLTDKGKEY